MLFILCSVTNCDLIKALNGGVFPEPVVNSRGGVSELYLKIQPGEENQLVTHAEMWAMKEHTELVKTMRQFYFAK